MFTCLTSAFTKYAQIYQDLETCLTLSVPWANWDPRCSRSAGCQSAWSFSTECHCPTEKKGGLKVSGWGNSFPESKLVTLLPSLLSAVGTGCSSSTSSSSTAGASVVVLVVLLVETGVLAMDTFLKGRAASVEANRLSSSSTALKGKRNWN